MTFVLIWVPCDLFCHCLSSCLRDTLNMSMVVLVFRGPTYKGKQETTTIQRGVFQHTYVKVQRDVFLFVCLSLRRQTNKLGHWRCRTPPTTPCLFVLAAAALSSVSSGAKMIRKRECRRWSRRSLTFAEWPLWLLHNVQGWATLFGKESAAICVKYYFLKRWFVFVLCWIVGNGSGVNTSTEVSLLPMCGFPEPLIPR